MWDNTYYLFYFDEVQMKDCFCFNEVANCGNQLTLRDLANKKEYTFWKFCQSHEGMSIEGHFAQYEVGKITQAASKDKGLSFVNNSTISNCYMYGDTLVKFVFDNSNPVFRSIADCPVQYRGLALGEYEAEKLLPEKIYSLEKIETIRLIFEHTRSKPDFIHIFSDCEKEGLSFYLEKYGFYETSALVKKLKIYFNNNFHNDFDFLKKSLLIQIDNYLNTEV